MKKCTLYIAVLILTAAFDCAHGCTTIFLARGPAVFACFNMDYSNCYPKIWIVPPSEARYGRFCFGFDENYAIAEGGMNEKGLFIAVNALNEDTGWKADPALPNWEEWSGWFETGVPDGILAKCATVGEAVRVFQEHNLFTLNKVKFLVADKTGASVVIEWSTNGLTFIERAHDYQISTNFVTSNFAPDEYPCVRYRVAEQIVSAPSKEHPVDMLRSALSASHLEFTTPTVYSNICDLATGDIAIYYFHNYEEIVKLNLFEELKRGASRHLVESLFPIRPAVSEMYKKYSKRR